jgi:hypothetical protein
MGKANPFSHPRLLGKQMFDFSVLEVQCAVPPIFLPPNFLCDLHLFRQTLWRV